MEDIDEIANSITKAIAYAENGGKVDIKKPVKGKTGEMASLFQYTPATWRAYSKEILGKDNVPLDSDIETFVTREKVKKWVTQGRTASEIASMWNAGEGKPDAYKTGHKGVNAKYGVAYDTPAYAKKVLDYSKKFYSEKKTPQGTLSTPQQAPAPQTSEPLNNLMGIISNVKKPTAPPQKQVSGMLPNLANAKVN